MNLDKGTIEVYHAGTEIVELPDYYNQEIIDILRWGSIGIIVCRIAKLLNITPLRALKDFYRSDTCSRYHDRKTGLYLYSEYYIADEYLLERQANHDTTPHPAELPKG